MEAEAIRQIVEKADRIQVDFLQRIKGEEFGLLEKINHLCESINGKISVLQSYKNQLILFQKNLTYQINKNQSNIETQIQTIQDSLYGQIRESQESFMKNLVFSLQSCCLEVFKELNDQIAQGIDQLDFKTIKIPFYTIAKQLNVQFDTSFQNSVISNEEMLSSTFMGQLKEYFNVSISSQTIPKSSVDIGTASKNKIGNLLEDELESFHSQNQIKSKAQEDSSGKEQTTNQKTHKSTHPILSKVKALFGPKQDKDKENYTKAHIGEDSSNFTYDPKSKRYVFKGEKQEEQAELHAPPKSGEVSQSETQDQQSMDDINSSEQLQSSKELIVPHMHNLHRKKGKSKQNSIGVKNEVKQLFNPQQHAFVPSSSEIYSPIYNAEENHSVLAADLIIGNSAGQPPYQSEAGQIIQKAFYQVYNLFTSSSVNLKSLATAPVPSVELQSADFKALLAQHINHSALKEQSQDLHSVANWFRQSSEATSRFATDLLEQSLSSQAPLVSQAAEGTNHASEGEPGPETPAMLLVDEISKLQKRTLLSQRLELQTYVRQCEELNHLKSESKKAESMRREYENLSKQFKTHIHQHQQFQQAYQTVIQIHVSNTQNYLQAKEYFFNEMMNRTRELERVLSKCEAKNQECTMLTQEKAKLKGFISQLKSQIQSKELRLSNLSTELAHYQDQNSHLLKNKEEVVQYYVKTEQANKQQIEELQAEISQQTIQIQQLQETCKELTAHNENLESTNSELKCSVSAYQQNQENLESEIQNFVQTHQIFLSKISSQNQVTLQLNQYSSIQDLRNVCDDFERAVETNLQLLSEEIKKLIADNQMLKQQQANEKSESQAEIAKWKRCLTDYQSQIEKLNSEKQIKDSQLKDLLAENDQGKATAQEQKSEIHKLLGEINTLTAKQEELTRTLEKMQGERQSREENHQTEMARLTEKMKQQEKLISELSSQLTVIEQSKLEYDQHIQELLKEKAQLELNAQLQDKQLQTINSQLKQQSDAFQSEIDQKVGENKELKSKINQLELLNQSQLSKSQSELIQLQTENRKLQQQQQKYKSFEVQIQKILESIKLKEQSKNNQLNQLQEKAGQQEQTIRSLQQINQDLTNKLTLQDQLIEETNAKLLETQRKEQQEGKEQSQEIIADLQAQLEKSSDFIEQLKLSVQKLEQDNSISISQQQNLELENKNLQHDLQTANLEKSELKASIDALAQQIQEVLQKNQILQDQCSEFQIQAEKRSQLQMNSDERDNQIEQLEEQVDVLASKLLSAQDTLNRISEENQKLVEENKHIDLYKNQINDYDNLKQAYEKLILQNNKTKAELSELMAQNLKKNSAHQIDASSQEYQQLQRDYQQLQKKMEDQIQRQQNKVTSQPSDNLIKELQEEISELTEDKKKLKIQIDEILDKYNLLKKQNEIDGLGAKSVPGQSQATERGMQNQQAVQNQKLQPISQELSQQSAQLNLMGSQQQDNTEKQSPAQQKEQKLQKQNSSSYLGIFANFFLTDKETEKLVKK